MSRIQERFAELRISRKKAFIVFLTCGFPDMRTTERLILELVDKGVDIIELGVPFSDPIADGPIIQASSQEALKKGVHLRQILKFIKRLRRRTAVALTLFSYYNPLFHYPLPALVREAASSGVDGFIVPDLPPEEAGGLRALTRQSGLDTIFFLSPTSTPERVRFVNRVSTGFIYYVSVTGVTGPRARLPHSLTEHLARLRCCLNLPVCVGFGIARPHQVNMLKPFCDGIIVGSAITRQIQLHRKDKDVVKRVGRFVAGLVSALKR
jgi:tryptophan synthase alpha chain